MHPAYSSQRNVPVDAIIVGAGPTGSLVAEKLAAQGLSVTIIEAGKRFGGYNSLENNEANAGKIMWSEARNHVGSDFIVPKTGVGVGGGTMSWLGVMPRVSAFNLRQVRSSVFRAKTRSRSQHVTAFGEYSPCVLCCV